MSDHRISETAPLRFLHMYNFVFNRVFLRLFIVQPNFLALKVDMLSNQTWAQSFSQ